MFRTVTRQATHRVARCKLSTSSQPVQSVAKRVSNGSGAPWLFGFGCGAAAGFLVAAYSAPLHQTAQSTPESVTSHIATSTPAATKGRIRVHSDLAPQSGPYSQAIAADGKTIYISSQVGRIPGTNTLVEGGVCAQTKQALNNLANVLDTANSEVGLICKTTVLLGDMEDYAEMNKAYNAFFAEHVEEEGTAPPARAAFAVHDLPLGAKVEIEAIALERRSERR